MHGRSRTTKTLALLQRQDRARRVFTERAEIACTKREAPSYSEWVRGKREVNNHMAAAVQKPLPARRQRAHLAAVQRHREVSVLRLARPRKHRRDRLAHQLHLGHVAAAPNQMYVGHGNSFAGGDTPVLMGHGRGGGRIK